MGKGEIAHYEQFLLFPQCFQKAFSQGRQKVSLCGNGLNISTENRTTIAELWLTHAVLLIEFTIVVEIIETADKKGAGAFVVLIGLKRTS